MSNLEEELNQLKDLIINKEAFLNDIKKLARYREKFKMIKANLSRLQEASFQFEADKKTILDKDSSYGNSNYNFFHFNNPEIINWMVSVLELILQFKSSILKEELANIKKGK